MQSGPKLLACVSSWELDVKTGCESWDSRTGRFVPKRLLNSQVGVSKPLRRSVPFSLVNGEIWKVHIDLEAIREAIVELEVRCILSSIGVLKLEAVILIEELEMALFEFSDGCVIGIERELGLKLPSDTEYAT